MAITFVNAYADADAGGDGTIATTAQNHTTGNTIIVFAAQSTPGGRTVTGVADTASNSYSRAGTAYGQDADHIMDVWVATDITGNASNIVTVTFSDTSSYRGIACVQYSGLDPTAPYEAQSSGSLSSSGTTHTTGTATTTTADSLVLGFFGFWGGTQSAYSSSGSSTLRTADPSYDLCITERIVSSAGTYSAAVATASNTQQVMFAKTFKAASAGGSIVPQASSYYRMRAA